MGWGCCWSWLVRPGDTPDEARIKTLVFPFALCALVVAVFYYIVTSQQNNQIVKVVGTSIIALAMALFMGGVVSNAIPAGYLLDVMLVLCTVGICAQDLGQATVSYSFRSWAFVVLSLDCALVFKRDHLPRFIIALVLLYQCLLKVESVARFGLYEAGYWGGAGVEDSFCNCASPPCNVPAVDAVVNMLSVCIVLLGDFYFTNGFARGMELQLRKVE
eukprot:Hpha_TRINITY_DN16395_c1_g2::TRINITY_DN16395_c1_g2_i6::g.60517::m.60517